MNKDIVIELKNVTKKYKVHHDKPTLVEKVLDGKNETFIALKNINIRIKRGERLGLIGPNGSGKTTLLKIIAGITSPSTGKVETKGKLVSLIDLEAGFHPDLSGIQNIFLNGMLLGMSKRIINIKLNEIISFADIGKFIDAPLFTYSEGMKLRLGFSVAINADPDIILLDENMMVGDQDFKVRSFKKIKEFFRKGKTIIVVSHQMWFIKRMCNKVIWLNKGTIKDEGVAKVIIQSYEKSFI